MPDDLTVQKELISLSGKRYRFVSDRYYTRPGKFSVTYKGLNEQGGAVLLKKVIAGFIANEVSMPVRHPVLVPVTDIIRHQEEVYLVQEFREGKNLRDWLTPRVNGKEPEFREAILQVVDGLGALHAGGWMHGDVKPANIIVNSGQTPNVISLVDFGKASPIGVRPEGDTSFSLLYSSPEAILQESDIVGPAADYYALGISLYELIERRPAFQHANPELLMHLMLNQPLPAPRYIPDRLFSVIRKMTFRSVFPRPPHLLPREERRQLLLAAIDQRYQDATALRADLEAGFEDFRWPRPWWKRLLR